MWVSPQNWLSHRSQQLGIPCLFPPIADTARLSHGASMQSDTRKPEADEARRRVPLKKAAKSEQPGPPKKAGDDSPNPLPDDPNGEEGFEGGGDPGRG